MAIDGSAGREFGQVVVVLVSRAVPIETMGSRHRRRGERRDCGRRRHVVLLIVVILELVELAELSRMSG